MKRCEPWERRGAAIYTEGDTSKPGSAELIVELHGMCDAATVQKIVDAHNRDAGFDDVEVSDPGQ